MIAGTPFTVIVVVVVAPYLVPVAIEHGDKLEALLLGERGRVGRHETDDDGSHLGRLKLSVLVQIE